MRRFCLWLLIQTVRSTSHERILLSSILRAATTFMSNRTKETQLGMSLGVANHKLRRAVMFGLIVRLGINTCGKTKQIMSNQVPSYRKFGWERVADSFGERAGLINL